MLPDVMRKLFPYSSSRARGKASGIILYKYSIVPQEFYAVYTVCEKRCTFKTLYNCRLQVSWIRRSDAHILTVDDSTFISDGRFFILGDGGGGGGGGGGDENSLVRLPGRDRERWTLHIRYVVVFPIVVGELKVEKKGPISCTGALGVMYGRKWETGARPETTQNCPRAYDALRNGVRPPDSFVQAAQLFTGWNN